MDARQELGQDQSDQMNPDRRTCEAYLIRGGMLVATIVALQGATQAARAQDVATFYQGKEIRLIIGADVGGPYDAYGRLLGRHLARHIPGNPRLVLQNMAGATSV